MSAESIEHCNETFEKFLFKLIDAKNMTDPAVYKAANVGRKTFSDIRHGTVPEKKTVIKIIFALELSLDEARSLLELAGYALSPGLAADLIVARFIAEKNFDKFALDETLSRNNLPKIFF